VACLEGFEPPT